MTTIAVDAVGIRMGGGARVLCDLMEVLPQYRPSWKWHVYVLPESKRSFSLPVGNPQVSYTPVRLGNHPFGRIFWVNKLLPVAVTKIRADVLFSLSNLPSSNSAVPSVVFFHQPNIVEPLPRTLKNLQKRVRMAILGRLFLRGAQVSSIVLVQTETMRSAIAQRYPSLESRLRTIPSGVEQDRGEGEVRLTVRQQIDGASRPRLLYVALPYAHKNHETLIAAYSKVRSAIPSCSLLLTLPAPEVRAAGKGGSLNLASIHKAARKYDVERAVQWLGTLTHAEVGYALRNSDAMVFPSLRESFGLPLVESMVEGCPLVAADRPYAREIAGSAAAYFNPDSPAEMAEALMTVITSPQILNELRYAGASRKDLFLYENICPTLLDTLESCFYRNRDALLPK